jgi:uncharacterized MAPEG superfamily protein
VTRRLGGYWAEDITGTMNAATGAYLALRVLYTVLYIKTTERKTSFLRSITWGASVLTLMGLYVKAGKEWAAR